MRLFIPCFDCIRLGKLASAFRYVAFREDGRYDTECPGGHKSSALLQQHRFELLFEIGANAILDGYYREAVSSFAASLERFYEFAIRVFLANKSSSDQLFQQSWKLVGSHSERQLGAFIFLWASHFKAPPTAFPNKQTEFRNKVVHKGRIPSRDEALDFGTAVLTHMRPQLALLMETFPEQIIRVTHYHLRDMGQTRPDGPNTTMCTNTLVSTSVATMATDTLEEYVTGLAKQRDEYAKLGVVA